MPFYSYVFSNSHPFEAVDPHQTRALGWSRIADLQLNEGWTTRYDSASATFWGKSPDGKSFFAADNEQVIRQKTAWAVSSGYGGVFCWSMDHERMPDGTMPLSKAIQDGIKKGVRSKKSNSNGRNAK